MDDFLGRRGLRRMLWALEILVAGPFAATAKLVAALPTTPFAAATLLVVAAIAPFCVLVSAFDLWRWLPLVFTCLQPSFSTALMRSRIFILQR